jgi:hypothetical protein
MATISDQDQLQQLFSTMDQRLQRLQAQVDKHSSILDRLDRLETENKVLLEKNKDQGRVISELQGQLFETQKKLKFSKLNGTAQDRSNVPEKKATNLNSPPRAPAATAQWTEVVKRKPKEKKVTPKRKEAISRGFNPVSGEQGYEYIYINRSRRFTRVQVRDNLRLLGIETSRILDVAFPASGIIGLLVHVQYKDLLVAILAKAKVYPVSNFDPTDPKHIADPAHANKSEEERQVIAMRAHMDRCLRALHLLFLLQRHSLLPVGWIMKISKISFLLLLVQLSIVTTPPTLKWQMDIND